MKKAGAKKSVKEKPPVSIDPSFVPVADAFAQDRHVSRGS